MFYSIRKRRILYAALLALISAVLSFAAGCAKTPGPAVPVSGIMQIPQTEEQLFEVCASARRLGSTYLEDRREEQIGTYLADRCALLVRRVSYGEGRDTVTCYVADVFISDMSQFFGYVGRDGDGKIAKIPASAVLEEVNAPLLINADFLSARSWGLYVRGGEVVRSKSIDKIDLCLIGTDGKMRIVNGDEVSKSDLLGAPDLYHIFSFGPSLLNADGTPRNADGEFHITDKYSKWNNYESSVGFPVPNPRTAVGQAEDGHFIFMTVDGRMKGFSRGVSFPELSHMMYEEGAVVAYNMDGGGSEIMCFKGEELTRQYAEDAKRIPSDYICILPDSRVGKDANGKEDL